VIALKPHPDDLRDALVAQRRAGETQRTEDQSAMT
jgi:hypothetical protein